MNNKSHIEKPTILTWTTRTSAAKAWLTQYNIHVQKCEFDISILNIFDILSLFEFVC